MSVNKILVLDSADKILQYSRLPENPNLRSLWWA